jgi:hypothetical protein
MHIGTVKTTRHALPHEPTLDRQTTEALAPLRALTTTTSLPLSGRAPTHPFLGLYYRTGSLHRRDTRLKERRD